MKKNILAIAIATAVAAPAAMADAKIYGYFNTALENVSERGTTWDNRNSRIGIKGSEDLGNGLKAIYQFETGVDINKGEWNNADRNSYIGLAGNFGTVLAGKHDTPLRMIQPTDHFADAQYAGSNRSTFNGVNEGQGRGANYSGEDRLDNVLAYISPSFEGFQVALAGAHNSSGSPKEKDTSPTNAYSASISYGKKSDGLYLALAGTKVSDKYAGDANERQNYRATAQYRADGLTANMMYNNIKADDTKDKAQSITVGLAYDIDAFTPKAKIAHVKYNPSGDKSESHTNFALGVDYKLGKNTKTFVEVAQIDKKQFLTIKNGKEKATTAISIGMNHKF